ncbi:MAG: glycosyltransferase family 2 protein, partial [Flavobacteriales bacterium]|nr:glycosyltransferase family 2 protein [Flavobacteriales bacterium]
MKISAVIITFNEEKNIRRCLESLMNVVDEILVVDSFSTDATESICNEFNARFEQRPWKDYSDQKNFANSLVSGDYILSIDADEALSDELKKSILEIKA